jgi:glucose/arabinose dehydrogenase
MTLELSTLTSLTDTSIEGSFGQPPVIGSSVYPASQLSESSKHNLVFVDADISDVATLTKNIKNAEIIFLDRNLDGVVQITNALNQRSDVDSVHVFSHGSSGDILLGSSHLNLGNLQNYSSSFNHWQDALTEDADILLYGCDVGAGADGLEFVKQLSQMSGADIAASNNITGNVALGGDWELEVKAGKLETATFAALDYAGILPIYNGKQYQLTSSAKSWEQAQAEAQKLGGNLVTVNDAAEEAWLKQSFGTKTPLWIGLTDRTTERNFQWVNGESTTYRNWVPGRPDNYTFGGAIPGGEDYVAMNWGTQQQWEDIPNSYIGTYFGIVETPAPAADPGVLALESSTYQVDERTGTLTVNVTRKGGGGEASIDYRTVDALAKAGSDYTAASGRLTFASGDTSKSIIISILSDTIAEGNENFNLTIDNPIGNVTLLAPRTATINILDDEAPTPLFALNDFSKVDDLALNGNASQQGTNLQLTPNQKAQAGTAFLKRPLAIDTNTSFSTKFQFQLAGGTDGADGFTFVLQNDANNVKSIGGPAGGLGYVGIGKSVAIEFDTYQGPLDSGNNQISLLRDGNVDQAITAVNAPFDLNSGNPLTAWIEYDGTTNNLQVFLSDTTTRPGTAAFSSNIDLETVVGNQAFLGFSAGTGGASNTQSIQNWSFISNSSLLAAPPVSSSILKQTTVSKLNNPIAIDWTPDGSKMFIAEKGGVIKVVQNGQTLTNPFIDISSTVNTAGDRGLLDIAVHPDFFNGKPYIYALYVYDPPETAKNTGLAGVDGGGNRASRLTRITANAATNYSTAVAGSEVVILGKNSTWKNFNGFVDSTVDFKEPPAGILPNGTNLQDFLAVDSETHAVGSVEFGKDGALYISNGDGTSYNQVDPRTSRVQDINNLSGKILRIDPITGAGRSDNPFYNGDPNANVSKVYQYGLRNPFRIAVQPDNGQLYVGDVGWTQWEEINSALAGANFGWPWFSGGNDSSLKTPSYQDLPEAQAFYASGKQVTLPSLALNHATDGINAIILGGFYTGNNLPTQYKGDLFFNDLGQGIIRNVSFDAAGKITSIDVFTTGAQNVVQMAQGPDGNYYYVNIGDGTVGRWIYN